MTSGHIVVFKRPVVLFKMADVNAGHLKLNEWI